MPKFSQVGVSMWVLAAVTSAFAADPVTEAVWQRLRARSATTMAGLTRQFRAEGPLPESGVTEVAFSEFLAPAGPDGGLEFMPRLRSLAGKRVRIAGYMVRTAAMQPGVFVLAPQPITIEADGTCFVTELPPHVVHVHAAAAQKSTQLPYRPGWIAFTGVLQLGAQREADGRNSFIRLMLDAPLVVPADVSKPVATKGEPANRAP